ncbi:MAG: gliding motility-associated C-terminal domain-containing protein [Saprospiraceae bacterium]|nr:gliding motility-associated C-terminal domain-containing protein [Saprospiraceae bacterium]
MLNSAINYFSIDGIQYFSSTPTPLQWPFTSPNLALDTTIFLHEGCHDITCSFSDYNDGKVIAAGCVSINIDGSIRSISSDSTILQEACFENKPPIVIGDHQIKVCKDCELISPNYQIEAGRYCTTLSTVKIYFEEGYEQFVDTLILKPKHEITSNFDSNTGVLTLSGNSNFGVWEEIIRTICYRQTRKGSKKSKKIIIVLGDALFNSENGHYYKLIKSNVHIDWNTAERDSKAQNLFGVQGYLVTITDSGENNFLSRLIQSNSWIGASDRQKEGEWRWVTGCEGLEDGGKGRHFSNQDKYEFCRARQSSGVNGYYANWYVDMVSGEPNDCQCWPANHCEDYAHFIFVNGIGDGTWNDFPLNGVSQVKDYIVEFGCGKNDMNIHSEIFIDILEPSESFVSAEICEGNSYHGYTTSGIYMDTLIASNGCDSIRNLNLSVHQSENFTETRMICEGENYKGRNKTGVYIDTLFTIKGCDSIVSLNLQVNPIQNFTRTIAVCANRFPFEGHSFPGIYFDTLTTYLGCDSIVELSLTKNDLNTVTRAISICENEFFEVNNKKYNMPGIYIDTLRSLFDCDTIYTLNLEANPIQYKQLQKEICEGDFFQVGNSRYFKAGLYVDTMWTIYNCDSVVELSLIVHSHNVELNTIEICESDSVKVGHNTYFESGIYIDSLKNEFNCDSVIQTQLKVNSIYKINIEKSICEGDYFKFGNRQISNAGIFQDSLNSSKGCDSIVILDLEVRVNSFKSQEFTICDGDYVTVGSNIYDADGIYTDSLISQNNCDSVLTSRIKVNPTQDLSLDSTYCINSYLKIVEKHLDKNEIFYLKYLNQYGCDSLVTLDARVRKCNHIYVPNVFSPNGDNINDYFDIYGIDVDKFELYIYDRWGEQIYYTQEIEKKWDGTFRGQAMNPGVFVFLIKGKYFDQTPFLFTGDITLIK